MKIISLNKGCFAFIFGLLLWCNHTAAYNNDLTHHLWQSTVSGVVRDANGPLPGVTVSVNGSGTTAVTDEKGSYTINAAIGDTLVFSFLGFKDSEYVVTSESLDAVLQEDVAQLQEVVINAGYYRVKDKERTGSISRITSKDIENQPVTNVLATMQGRMAGVSVTQTTGVPGGGFDIQIRGLNSLRSGGNSPLYIVDGVPYSSEPIGSQVASTVMPSSYSPLNSLNPEQIESIEVLKDADATSIYGSRGANGVVLITTKKGKTGVTKYSARLYQGVGSLTRKMDLLSTAQYIEMRREGYANDGIAEIPDSAYDINGTWDTNRSTDWQEEILGKTAYITNAQASVSGGSSHTQFLLGGSLNRQSTVFPEDFNYNKGNAYVNLGHTSEDDRFSVKFSGQYTFQENNQPRIDLTQEAITLPPNAPNLRNADGSLNWENSTFGNPLRNLEGEYNAKTYDLIVSSVLSYRLAKGLEVRSNFGYSSLSHKEVNASPSTQYDPAYGLTSDYSSLVVTDASRRSWIIEPQLNWQKELGEGRIDVLAGTTFQSQTGDQLVLYGSGFSSNSLIYNLASAGFLMTMASDATEYRYHAIFGRVNFTWKERYFLNLTGRRDGSSRFGPGKQFANFGAVGAAWLFSQEKWFSDSKVLSFGKLRASYGITGNDQIGDYQYLDTYASSGVSYGGVIGLQPARLFNPDFGWETNRKFEAAIEAGFLKDRLFLTLGWYKNRSSNQLAGIPLPGTTGFSSIQANLDATVENSGLEVTLRTVNFERENFSWITSFNLSAARNKLISFPNLDGSTYATQYVIGHPLNIRKVYHSLGVDPETGIYRFEDSNADGALSSADKQTVKDMNPEFFGGLQNTLRYKRWQFDFLFQFVKQQNFNETAFFGYPGGMSNQPADVMNRWQQPGDTAKYQRFTSGSDSQAVDAYYKYMESDAAISDASFVRLKNLSVSYELPFEKAKCRIFIEGQNLLTFTSYRGADPEFRAVGYLPPLKVFAAGIQLSF